MLIVSTKVLTLSPLEYQDHHIWVIPHLREQVGSDNLETIRLRRNATAKKNACIRWCNAGSVQWEAQCDGSMRYAHPAMRIATTLCLPFANSVSK